MQNLKSNLQCKSYPKGNLYLLPIDYPWWLRYGAAKSEGPKRLQRLRPSGHQRLRVEGGIGSNEALSKESSICLVDI